MKITEVNVRKVFEDSPSRAIVSITIDDAIAIHNIRVIVHEKKRYLSFPDRPNKHRKGYLSITHPITQEARQEIETAVFAAFDDYIAENKT